MLKIALDSLKYGESKNPEDKHDEYQYINLIKHILDYGTMIEGRNGNALTIYGSSMHFSLENNTWPLLTSKKVAWKTCAKELFWFLKGSTSNTELQEQNVHIWDGNGSRDFLDSRGLTNLQENDLGPVYGHQWRFFNASYENCNTDYSGKGVDQIKYIIDCLKNPKERYSRRLILSAWNPEQLDEMALPPCHVLAQFNVIGNFEREVGDIVHIRGKEDKKLESKLDNLTIGTTSKYVGIWMVMRNIQTWSHGRYLNNMTLVRTTRYKV